jgi:hypothetical protein
MTPFTASIDAIRRDFEQAGIDTSCPGFYDHPAFQAREAEAPDYLNNYARYVRAKQFDSAYLARAEKVIRTVANMLAEELVKDGRMGACVDLNMVLSRILDKEGVWNHIVSGSLTVNSPAGTLGRFLSIDTGNFAAGHAWLFAPPFDVVDITVKQQPYNGNIGGLFPQTILEKTVTPFDVKSEDVCSAVVLRYFASQGLPRKRALFTAAPHLREFFPLFPANLITQDPLVFRYVPVAVSASDAPLERIVNYPMSGRFGAQIYQETIKPALAELAG